jgi:2-hydroxychromene-2-carboxylate isomerase
MQQLRNATLYFDVISPFAYLMHATLEKTPLDLKIEYKPVLFAAMLNTFGQKGPAEIPSKRIATYEYCTWLGQARGIPFLMPAAHPFNPMRYLRLILACDCRPDVIARVYRLLFTTGLDPEDEATWTRLKRELFLNNADELIDDAMVKQRLRANTDEAIALGVFGVPTIVVDSHLFWGLDSLPMLDSYLSHDGSLDTAAMQHARQVRVGATRRA